MTALFQAPSPMADDAAHRDSLADPFEPGVIDSASKLEELISLSRETSSERRRELLRGVTDLFLAADEPSPKRDMLDAMLVTLASEMEVEVRAELAARLAPIEHAPKSLMCRLAGDEIAVAAPVLYASRTLTETDLLEVVDTRSQAHLRLVSTRGDLTEKLADRIVDKGDDETLGVLLRNERAPLSRASAEKAVDRAGVNPELHEAVVGRRNLPADLLDEMYFVVEARLRQRIVEASEGIDPAEVEAALEVSRTRMAARDGALPDDYAEAGAYVDRLFKAEGLQPQTLAALLRRGERTRFLVALSRAADLDFNTARRLVDRRDLDALAIACKAADFNRALFLTLALLLQPEVEGGGMGKAELLARRYAELPRETALRAIRFWRLRRSSGDRAAA